MHNCITYTFILVNFLPFTDYSCGKAEYYSGDGCCPVCAPGYYVLRHCTEYTSTTCAPCPMSTFTDHANGLTSCLSCTVCDKATGLRVKRECSSTSDTLCEPLEGHYCTDPIQDGCRGAVEHTKCKPGQYIKENGTASTDTVCEDCGNNTYSDGTFTFCRLHTQCEVLGMDVIQEGTMSSDAQCGRSHKARTIIMPGVGVMLLTVVVVLMLFYRRRREDLTRQGNTISYSGTFRLLQTRGVVLWMSRVEFHEQFTLFKS
ncbi:hypothetical protein ACEWY4_000263 [Coilia grayii]|uniref:TNFR-Cys domain-containing protein n=1 Tax=Coilia grayii TaxID=363190 RepID=A0ABD1KW79_9TELE